MIEYHIDFFEALFCVSAVVALSLPSSQAEFSESFKRRKHSRLIDVLNAQLMKTHKNHNLPDFYQFPHMTRSRLLIFPQKY